MHRYDLTTKEGINSFIENELGYIEGLIANMYRKNKNDYKVLGYEIEDLIQEAYIWAYEKLSSGFKVTDVEHARKKMTLEIKGRMSNLINKAKNELKTIGSCKVYRDTDNKNNEDFILDTQNDSLEEHISQYLNNDKFAIKIEELRGFLTDVEYSILYKRVKESKGYRKISKELRKEGIFLEKSRVFHIYNDEIIPKCKKILLK
jgi:hypothetical protein